MPARPDPSPALRLLLALSCLGAASSFQPPLCGGIAGLRRPVAARMTSGDGDGGGRIEELRRRRDELLEEKAALLKKRKLALSTEIAKLERDQQTAPRIKAPAAGQRDDGVVDGLFGLGGGGGAPDGRDTRRGFFSRFLTGLGLTFFSIGALVSLLGPGIERLAYLSFASLYEEGVIFLTKQTEKAVKERDYGAIIEQTLEGGKLDTRLIQPMIFWAQGNAGDDDQEWVKGLAEQTNGLAAAVQALNAAALAKDNAALDSALVAAKKSVLAYTRSVNQKVPQDLPPLAEIAE